jgi:hypothetical protein
MERSAPEAGRGGKASAAKRRLRAKLGPEERSLRKRLKAAVAPNFSGPVLGRANVVYELAERTRAVAHGGMGMVAKVVEALGLAEEIDASLDLLALHKPYYESDHVLNIASAPRGALTYPLLSREGLEVTSLGQWLTWPRKRKGTIACH